VTTYGEEGEFPIMTAGNHVVVVGGGVLGVSTATHLQREGAQVVLVTEGELADGASGRSLSWLNSAGSRSPGYHALRVAGIDRYRTLFAADPTRDWLRFDGALHWAADPGLAHRRHEAEAAHGYDSALLTAAGIAAAVPGLDPAALPGAGVHNPGEGWVSLPHLIAHLAAEFTGLGGRLVTGAGRASVTTGGGAATGVTTAHGHRFEAGAVVVACGAATPAVVAELGVTIPDASPLSMLVLTEPVRTRLKAVLNTPRVSLRPHPGGAFALDHDWYEDLITEAPDGTCTVDESVVRELVAEAAALLAGDVTLTAATWKLGRKPVPGDGEPVLGELPTVPRCFVAFTHSGATLGLIAGELLAGEVRTGTPHPLLEPFRPGRFRADPEEIR
jgi:glycine/D-amino acid oxidase-like deaminating enzyme